MQIVISIGTVKVTLFPRTDVPNSRGFDEEASGSDDIADTAAPSLICQYLSHGPA